MKVKPKERWAVEDTEDQLGKSLPPMPKWFCQRCGRGLVQVSQVKYSDLFYSKKTGELLWRAETKIGCPEKHQSRKLYLCSYRIWNYDALAWHETKPDSPHL